MLAAAFRPGIVSDALRLYVCSMPSRRMVEDMLAARGILASSSATDSLLSPCDLSFASRVAPMLSKKKVLGLVEAGRKISRAPLVRVDALHERAMGLPDFRRPGARPKAQDLIGFLFRQRARARRAALPR